MILFVLFAGRLTHCDVGFFVSIVKVCPSVVMLFDKRPIVPLGTSLGASCQQRSLSPITDNRYSKPDTSYQEIAWSLSLSRVHSKPLSIFLDVRSMEDDDNDDLFRCAICGTAEGDSSNLTSQSSLQTNATVGCGHQFCNSCVERELSRRKEFSCPIDGISVKRVTLSTRTLDDFLVEKDTGWRRRVTKVFNKVEKDFKSLVDYNNYLEKVEDIIYSIVNEESNAEEMKAMVKTEEEANKSEIVIRQSRRADEERSIADRIAAEQREAERRKREIQEEESIIAIKKQQFKQETAEVLLGEREDISAELKAAQMQGYRNELRRQGRGKAATSTVLPRVREPEGGLQREKKMDRELYRKRQAAGSGIPSGGNIATQERNWNEAVSSLFPTLDTS